MKMEEINERKRQSRGHAIRSKSLKQKRGAKGKEREISARLTFFLSLSLSIDCELCCVWNKERSVECPFSRGINAAATLFETDGQADRKKR